MKSITLLVAFVAIFFSTHSQAQSCGSLIEQLEGALDAQSDWCSNLMSDVTGTRIRNCDIAYRSVQELTREVMDCLQREDNMPGVG